MNDYRLTLVALICACVAVCLLFASGELKHRRKVEDDEREHRQTMERIRAVEKAGGSDDGNG